MSRSRRNATLVAVLTLALLLPFLVAFTPIQLGGRAAFVIINGNSMEPLYHRGDLVVVRAEDAYQIGDIVTYRHPRIGPVIHRIIGHEQGRWVFQGDHNTFIDPYQPTDAELIGKSWIYIPEAGKLLERARSPLALAILTVMMGVLFMSSAPSSVRRNRRSGRRGTSPAPNNQLDGSGAMGLILALGLAALAFCALSVWTLTLPITRDVSQELTYAQTGRFSYSAAAPAGIYDQPAAQTGEPIFFKLSNVLQTEFAYQLDTDKPLGPIDGSYRIVAEISSANGWKRTIELQPEQPFQSASFTASGVLQLDQVQTLINNLQESAELNPGEYVLAIIGQVRVATTLDGVPFKDDLDSKLAFKLDDTQLQPIKDLEKTDKPFETAKPGLLKHNVAEPNSIGLMSFQLPVLTARWIGMAGLPVTIVALVWLGLPLLRRVRSDEPTRIQLKYGAMMIRSAGGGAAKSSVTLGSIDDLARLAEKHGTVIMHETDGIKHRYVVHDLGISYLYEASETPGTLQDTASAPNSIGGQYSQPAAMAIDPLATAALAPNGDIPIESWHTNFLAALRETGSAFEACRAIGIGIATAYRERQRLPAFDLAWQQAQASFAQHHSSEV